MTTLFSIAAAAIFIGLVIFLGTRTRLTVRLRDNCLVVSLTLIGCGISFTGRGNRFGIVCGKWTGYLKFRDRAARKPKIPKRRPPQARKKRPGFPVSTWIKIGKALVFFAARFLSHVHYEEGTLAVQPVIANPALAGMAYGWGKAFYGAFPAFGRVLSISPAHGTESSRVSGHIVFSVENRRILVDIFRLLRDLPIKDIITYRFFKRGN